jgi:hypothetical protein
MQQTEFLTLHPLKSTLGLRLALLQCRWHEDIIRPISSEKILEIMQNCTTEAFHLLRQTVLEYLRDVNTVLSRTALQLRQMFTGKEKRPFSPLESKGAMEKYAHFIAKV